LFFICAYGTILIFIQILPKLRHILHNQGIEVLVNLLKDERDSTKAYACTSLTNMATDEIIREEVSQFQFTQSILPALNSPLVLFF
jgi:hypothetical protein